MELKISREELAKKKIMICTPMYGGQCFGMYTKSCLDLQSLLGSYGVNVQFSFLFNESLIQR